MAPKVPPCVACGGKISAAEPGVESKAFPGSRYRPCSRCGSLSASPLPGPVQLQAYYNKLYLGTWKRNPLDGALQVFRVLSERARAASILDAAGPERPGSCWDADVGAGNGELTRLLAASRSAEAQVLAIDAADEVLNLKNWAQACWKVPERELLLRLQKEPRGKFGSVFFSHSLEHFLAPDRVLKAFARRMAPGGRIVIDFPHGGHPHYASAASLPIPDLFFWTREGMAALADKAGLVIESERGLSPGPAFLAERASSLAQYAAAGLMVLKKALGLEPYFRARPALWYRVRLKRRA